MERRITVAIVDDHEATLLGIEAAFEPLKAEIHVAAIAETVSALMAQGDFDVVLLDLRLQDGSNPAQNIRMLTEAGSRVAVYTSGSEPYLIRSAAGAGAHGFVCKSEKMGVLVTAVRCVAGGGFHPSAGWAAALDSDPALPSAGLSAREKQVLAKIASGVPTIRIARLLGITVDTVNDHIRRIRSKYEAVGRPAPTRVDLSMRALEDGLVPLPWVR